jgi:hypothetical protein
VVVVAERIVLAVLERLAGLVPGHDAPHPMATKYLPETPV